MTTDIQAVKVRIKRLETNPIENKNLIKKWTRLLRRLENKEN